MEFVILVACRKHEVQPSKSQKCYIPQYAISDMSRDPALVSRVLNCGIVELVAFMAPNLAVSHLLWGSNLGGYLIYYSMFAVCRVLGLPHV